MSTPVFGWLHTTDDVPVPYKVDLAAVDPVELQLLVEQLSLFPDRWPGLLTLVQDSLEGVKDARG